MIIQVNHNDLDAMGCHFVLKKIYGDNIIQYNTSYTKIEEVLEKMHDKLSYDKTINEVYITDLSFNQSQFNNMLTIVEEFPNIPFTFIDHHPVLFDTNLSNFKNLKCILNISKSATLLTAELFNVDNTFVHAVNAFDLWKKNDKHFNYGFMLNVLYWDYKQKHFTYEFKSMGKPSQQHIADYHNNKAKKEKHFHQLKEKGLFIVDSGVLISFSDKHLNWIQIDYPNEDFYINATSYGTINVRIGESVEESKAGHLKEILSESLKAEEWFVDMGGHKRAFGIAHNGTNNHLIIVECMKHIIEEIKKMKCI